MFQLSHINLLVTAVVLGRLFAFLVASQEETNAANNDLLIFRQCCLLHDLDSLCVGPYLSLPELTRDLDSPNTLRRCAIRSKEVEENRLHGSVEAVVR